MALSSLAIEHFLDKPMPAMPEFKHAETKALNRTIYDSTGQFLEPVTEPRQYQLEGLAFALYMRRSLLLYDMRLGKSMMALAWAQHLKRTNLWRKGKGIVFAHSPLGLQVWATEARKHSTFNIQIVHTDPADFVKGITDPSVDLIVLPVSGAQELFTVWGTNKRDKAKRKLYPNLPLIADIAEDFELAIFDEIHMFKDHQSLRFQIAAALTEHCQFRLGLTGTPFGRDPYALWAQCFLIDRGKTLGHNYYFFEIAFGNKKKNYFSGRTEYIFDKRKLPKLEYKLSSLAMSYRREEVADQTVWEDVVELHMYGDQLEAYHDVINKLIKLPSGENAAILSTFHRLRQVSAGYLPFDDDEDERHIIHFKANPKLEWLTELVEAKPDVQIVIFHEYTHTGKLITDMLTKRKATFGWLYGGVTTLAKSNAIVSDFQQGRTQYLVANSVKGGLSIDLPQADYLIFYESPVSPITRQQAQARPMARGTRPLMIDDLTASPVDRRILDFLKEGRDILRSLTSERRRFRTPATHPSSPPLPIPRPAPRRRLAHPGAPR